MSLCNINSIISYNEELYDEIFNVDVIVNATKCCCQDREFRCEYYGIPVDFVHNISNERNEYLSLLTVISDKIHHINRLNKCIERELTLHHHADDCSG